MSPGDRKINRWKAWAKRLPDPIEALLRHSRSGGLFDPHARFSFSQEGEDLLLARLFDGQTSGFYVDVGAHHPTRFSNTYLLYRRGWHGINIDPTPGSMQAFERHRRRDVNLEIAISNTAAIVTLNQYKEPALNTTSQSMVDHRDGSLGLRPQSVRVQARRLADVLSEHVPATTNLDLLTVDVEGSDLAVLKSNDWTKYRPTVLVVEQIGASIERLDDLEAVSFMRAHGYRTKSVLVNSVVMVDETKKH